MVMADYTVGDQKIRSLARMIENKKMHRNYCQMLVSSCP